MTNENIPDRNAIKGLAGLEKDSFYLVVTKI